jgi:hypothetical protein
MHLGQLSSKILLENGDRMPGSSHPPGSMPKSPNNFLRLGKPREPR